jgi:hypothetical protein
VLFFLVDSMLVLWFWPMSAASSNILLVVMGNMRLLALLGTMIASDAPNWIMVGGTGVLEAVFLAMSVYFCLQVGACMPSPHTTYITSRKLTSLSTNTQVYLYVCTRRNSRKSVFWPSCRPATRIRSTSPASQLPPHPCYL